MDPRNDSRCTLRYTLQQEREKRNAGVVPFFLLLFFFFFVVEVVFEKGEEFAFFSVPSVVMESLQALKKKKKNPNASFSLNSPLGF